MSIHQLWVRLFSPLTLVLLTLLSVTLSGCASDQMQLDRANGRTLELAKEGQRLKGKLPESFINDSATSKELEPSINDYLSGKSTTNSQSKAGDNSSFKIQSN